MSKTIDQRVVEMTFNNKQFESGVSTSLTTLQKLKDSLKFGNAGKDLEKISDTASKINFNNMTDGLSKVIAKFGIINTIVTRVTNSVINFGKNLINKFAVQPITTGLNEYELKMGSVQVIMEGTGESISTVNKYLDELNEYSDKTIYSFQDMTSNIGKFTNAGVKLKDSVNAIKGISNAAALSGANANEASRAMYNFAQAISSGYVKYIDWKSIELANMATMQFKEQLLQTAAALGTIEDKGNGVYATTKQEVTAVKNFTGSLNDQWLTTDVLVTTLNKYSDETTEIGKRAYAAAKDVKTFSMMMGTLREAAQSGWARTWELVSGDYGESKKLFTDLSMIFGSVIDNSAKYRNEITKNIFSSNWKKLSEEIASAGISMNDFEDGVISRAQEYGINVDKIIKGEISLRDAFAKGQDDTNALIKPEIVKDFIMGLESSKEATIDEKNALSQLKLELTDSGSEFSKWVYALGEISGRESMWGAFENILKSILKITSTISEAFRNIFPINGQAAKSFLEHLNQITSKLILTDEAADKVRKVFESIFSVFKIGFSAIGKIVSWFGGIIDTLLENTKSVRTSALVISKDIGSALKKFIEWLDIGGAISKLFDILSKSIAVLQKVFSNFFNAISKSPITIKIIDSLKSCFSNLGKVIGKVANNLSVGLDKVFASFDSIKNISISDIGSVFGSLITDMKNTRVELGGTKGVFKSISEQIQIFISKISGFYKLGMEKTGEFANNILKQAIYIKSIIEKYVDIGRTISLLIGVFAIKGLGKIVSGIAKTVSGLAEAVTKGMNALAGGLKGINKIIDTFAVGMQKLFKAVAFEKKAEGIKHLAESLALIAGSLVALSLIPTEKLGAATGALVIVMGALILFIDQMNKAQGVDKQIGVAKSIFMLVTAIGIISFSLKKLSSITWGDALKSIIMLGLVLGGLIFAAKKLNGVSGSFGVNFEKGTGKQLIGIAVSIYAFSLALKKLSGFSFAEFLSIIGSLSIIILAMFGVSKVSKKLNPKSLLGPIAYAGAILLFAIALKELTKLKFSQILKATLELGIVIIALAALGKITDKANSAVVKIGASAAALGAGLLLVALAIKVLEDMDPESLWNAAAIIGILMTIMALVAGLSKFAGKHAAGAGLMLMEMALAIDLLVAGIAVLANIPQENVNRAVEIVALLVGMMGAIVAVSGLSKDATKTVKSMTIFIAVLTAIVVAFVYLVEKHGEAMKIAVGALIAIFTSIAILLGVIGHMKNTMGKDILVALGGLTAAVAAIGLILVGIGALSNVAGVSIEELMGISEAIALLMGAMSAAFVAITLASSVGSISMSGIGGFIAAVLGVGALMEALGVLQSLLEKYCNFDMKEQLLKGIDILNAIATGIGEFFGNIVTGFVDTIVDDLEHVGLELSKFGVAITPFLVSLKLVKPEMVQCVSIIADAILTLTKAKLLEGIRSLLHLGNNSMDTFITELGTLADGIKKFADATDGMSEDTVKKAKYAAEAGESIIKMARKIPNSGGLLSAIFGNNDLDNFSEMMPKFGEALSKLSENTETLKPANVAAAADAGEKIVKMAKNIPNTGGKISWLFGENDISIFAKSLPEFGTAIAEFAKNTESLTEDKSKAAISSAETAMTMLVAFAKDIPTTGGFFDKTVDLGTFGNNIAILGNKLAEYSISLGNVDFDRIDVAESKIKRLIDFAGEINEISNTHLSSFVDAFIRLANDGLNQFSIIFYNCDVTVNGAIQTFIDKMNKAVDNKKSQFTDKIKKMIESVLTDMKNKIVEFEDVGKKFIEALTKGFGDKNKIADLKKVISSNMNSAISALKYYESNRSTGGNSFYDTGVQLAQGLINGMDYKLRLVKEKAKDLGDAAAEALALAAQVKSPSRVTMRIGKFFALGFAEGIKNFSGTSVESTKKMVNDARDQLRIAIEQIKDFVSTDVDISPRISPVVNLDDAKKQINSLSNMLSSDRAYAISASITSREQRSRYENGVNGTDGKHIYGMPVQQFYQYNYSPKALSRIEIYRQTRNQFIAAKGLVTR